MTLGTGSNCCYALKKWHRSLNFISWNIIKITFLTNLHPVLIILLSSPSLVIKLEDHRCSGSSKDAITDVIKGKVKGQEFQILHGLCHESTSLSLSLSDTWFFILTLFQRVSSPVMDPPVSVPVTYEAMSPVWAEAPDSGYLMASNCSQVNTVTSLFCMYQCVHTHRYAYMYTHIYTHTQQNLSLSQGTPAQRKSPLFIIQLFFLQIWPSGIPGWPSG